MGSNWGESIEGGWFDEERHIYRDERGVIVPSTTQIFDLLGLVNYNGIDPAVIEWKARYGVAVHKAVEYLAFGKLDWSSCDLSITPAINGVQKVLTDLEYRPIATEELKIHSFNGMRVGMRLDHRGLIQWKGTVRPAVIDLKTCAKRSEALWGWQLGSYIGAAPKQDKPYLGLVIQVAQDGSVDLFWVTDPLKATREFCILLASAILKLNARLGKIKNVEED